MVELSPARFATFLRGDSTFGQVPKWPNAAASLHLLLLGCPAAIPWFVVSIVIDAIKLMLGACAASHVGKKILVFHPAFANSYSSTAPVFPIFTIAVTTAFTHRAPRSPLWRFVTFTVCSNWHGANMAHKLLQV